jgi:hypothetical protein
MDTSQANQVTMFKTVSAFLADNNPVWSGMAPLVAAVAQFNNRIAAIDVAAQKQQAPTGAVNNKEAARDALEDVLFLTCEALAVLGHTQNDHDLLALTAVSPSTLQRLTDEELSRRAATILPQATNRRAELATMQVTPANLDELDQAIQNFDATKASPRTATATRMAQTESLSALIREARGMLRDQIDRLVNLFRRSNSDFVAGYRGARAIVDRAATHKTKKPAESSPPTT